VLLMATRMMRSSSNVAKYSFLKWQWIIFLSYRFFPYITRILPWFHGYTNSAVVITN
jgi:hypothetical protein